MIVLVDNGPGNHASLANMFRRAGQGDVLVSGEHKAIREATGLVLPGVGHFSTAAEALDERGVRGILHERVLSERVPFLGVCVGMQLLFTRSEEGSGSGLGWLPGTVKRFTFDRESGLKVPNMGWREISPATDAVLFQGLPAQSRFYFAHSYYVSGARDEDVAATTSYGEPFPCAFERDNIFGVQFHPERSHRFGMTVLANFARVCR